MKKIWEYFVRFWKGIWAIIKSMGSWQGILSLFIVWLVLSGVGLLIIGFIIQNNWLMGIGTAIFVFWLGPFTPLIPLVIGLAMVVQRYVFLDKRMSFKTFKKAFVSTVKEGKDLEDFLEEETVASNDENKSEEKEEIVSLNDDENKSN